MNVIKTMPTLPTISTTSTHYFDNPFKPGTIVRNKENPEELILVLKTNEDKNAFSGLSFHDKRLLYCIPEFYRPDYEYVPDGTELCMQTDYTKRSWSGFGVGDLIESINDNCIFLVYESWNEELFKLCLVWAPTLSLSDSVFIGCTFTTSSLENYRAFPGRVVLRSHNLS